MDATRFTAELHRLGVVLGELQKLDQLSPAYYSVILEATRRMRRGVAQRWAAKPHWRPDSESEPSLASILPMVDSALNEIAKSQPFLAELLELHYFARLDTTSLAIICNKSPEEINRNLTFARSRLVYLCGWNRSACL